MASNFSTGQHIHLGILETCLIFVTSGTASKLVALIKQDSCSGWVNNLLPITFHVKLYDIRGSLNEEKHAQHFSRLAQAHCAFVHLSKGLTDQTGNNRLPTL